MSFLKQSENDSTSFDDCPVCEASKLAEEQGRAPTMEELHAAFLKAKEQGHAVGGTFFDEPKQ